MVKILRWAAVALSMLFATYCAMIVLFLISYHYASSKYEQIRIGDTRAAVEERKGFLISRKENRSYIEGYQFVSPFEQLVSNPENEIVSYSFLFVFFAVIYDTQGLALAKIDNGLDG